MPEPETIPSVKKKEATEGNYGAAAGLGGSESVSDTTLASTSDVKSLSVSESDCAAIVDSLLEERPSSVSAVAPCLLNVFLPSRNCNLLLPVRV